jgi:hypothetical protein
MWELQLEIWANLYQVYKQNVDQTLFRLKDGFKQHVYDSEIGVKPMALGLHSTGKDNNGVKDLEI